MRPKWMDALQFLTVWDSNSVLSQFHSFQNIHLSPKVCHIVEYQRVKLFRILTKSHYQFDYKHDVENLNIFIWKTYLFLCSNYRSECAKFTGKQTSVLTLLTNSQSFRTHPDSVSKSPVKSASIESFQTRWNQKQTLSAKNWRIHGKK